MAKPPVSSIEIVSRFPTMRFEDAFRLCYLDDDSSSNNLRGGLTTSERDVLAERYGRSVVQDMVMALQDDYITDVEVSESSLASAGLKSTQWHFSYLKMFADYTSQKRSGYPYVLEYSVGGKVKSREAVPVAHSSKTNMAQQVDLKLGRFDFSNILSIADDIENDTSIAGELEPVIDNLILALGQKQFVAQIDELLFAMRPIVIKIAASRVARSWNTPALRPSDNLLVKAAVLTLYDDVNAQSTDHIKVLEALVAWKGVHLQTMLEQDSIAGVLRRLAKYYEIKDSAQDHQMEVMQGLVDFWIKGDIYKGRSREAIKSVFDANRFLALAAFDHYIRNQSGHSADREKSALISTDWIDQMTNEQKDVTAEQAGPFFSVQIQSGDFVDAWFATYVLCSLGPTEINSNNEKSVVHGLLWGMEPGRSEEVVIKSLESLTRIAGALQSQTLRKELLQIIDRLIEITANQDIKRIATVAKVGISGL